MSVRFPPVNGPVIRAVLPQHSATRQTNTTIDKIAKTSLLKITDLTDALISIGEFLDKDDILTLTKTCRTFRSVFNSSPGENTNPAAAQILLSQVYGCQTLTSMRTLDLQLQGLKRHCPGHLGEGREWTIVEVLKRYDLKVINIPQGQASHEHIQELLTAFEEIHAMAGSICGNIQVFCAESYKADAKLFEFLKTFCPNIKELAVRCTTDEIQNAIFRFFSTPDRRDTLVRLDFRRIPSGLGQLELNLAQKDFILNQRNLEVFPSYCITSPEELNFLAEHCPKLSKLKVDMYQLREFPDGVKGWTEAFELLEKKCTKITKIVLRLVPPLDKNILALLKSVFEKNEKLNSLVLYSYLDVIDPENYESLLFSCKNLQKLAIEDIVPAELISQLPVVLPLLQILQFNCGIISQESLLQASVDCIRNGASLTQIALSSPVSESVFQTLLPILQLRRLNHLVNQENCSGRKLLDEMKETASVNKDIYFLVGIHENFPADIELALRNNLEILKSRKPLLSFHGNLLEQLIVKKCLEANNTLSRSYQKERLQAFQVMLSDEKMTQRQLYEIYKSLDKDTRETLAYHLWEYNNRPTEERFGENLIKTDIRCLLNILTKVIDSYER